MAGARAFAEVFIEGNPLVAVFLARVPQWRRRCRIVAGDNMIRIVRNGLAPCRSNLAGISVLSLAVSSAKISSPLVTGQSGLLRKSVLFRHPLGEVIFPFHLEPVVLWIDAVGRGMAVKADE
jgi:hypothetical protein